MVEDQAPGPREEPPADAEAWTDAQWIAWLNATDLIGLEDSDGQPVTRAGRAVHSPGGRALGQSMLGLAYAIYGRPEEKPAIVVGASSEPVPDAPFTLHLDVDHPERSFVVLDAEETPRLDEPLE
jgi:hypothetical protein